MRLLICAAILVMLSGCSDHSLGRYLMVKEKYPNAEIYQAGSRSYLVRLEDGAVRSLIFRFGEPDLAADNTIFP